MTLPNYYYILGLEFGASDEDIKVAYRKLSKKFHPDMNGGDKFFEQMFKEIQIAYEILSDPLRRAKYLKDYKNQYSGNKTNNASQQKENTREQTSRSEKQNPQPNSTSNSKPNRAKGKFSYSWLLITLPILIIFGLVKSSIQKSIRENAVQQALDNYTPSTILNSTTYNSDQSSETLSSDNYNAAVDTTVVIPSYSNPATNTDSTLTDENLTKAESTIIDNSGASKTETEEWILAKLRQYSQERIICPDRSYGYYSNPCTHYFDYQFSFDENNLVIRYNYDNIRYDIAKIPIYDFDKIYNKYSIYNSEISFFNKHNTVIKINTKTNEQRVSSLFTIGFRSDAETDLPTRIEKAMKHLKKYYSKPNTREPF